VQLEEALKAVMRLLQLPKEKANPQALDMAKRLRQVENS